MKQPTAALHVIDRRGRIPAKARDDRAEEIVYVDLPIPDNARLSPADGEAANTNSVNAGASPVK